MQCQNKKCGSKRVASVTAKCSDMFGMTIGEKEYNGYVPSDIGIGDKYGDYVEFNYCLDCGQIQGKFPLDKTGVEEDEEE